MTDPALMQAAQPTPPAAAPAAVPTAHYAVGAMPAPAYPMIPAAAHQFAAPTPDTETIAIDEGN